MRKLFSVATLSLSISASMTLFVSGCHSYTVISGDRQVVPMKQGVPHTPASDGYFVPNATMLDMLNAKSRDNLGMTNR